MNYHKLRKTIRDDGLVAESEVLRSTLEANGWSPKAAAKALEIAPSTLYRALDRHPELRTMAREKTPPRGRRPRKK